DAAFDQIQTHTLGPYGPEAAPVHVVEAGRWQAARPLGTYALVACTVGPGFDYADFALLRDRPDDAEALRRKHPGLSALLCTQVRFSRPSLPDHESPRLRPRAAHPPTRAARPARELRPPRRFVERAGAVRGVAAAVHRRRAVR